MWEFTLVRGVTLMGVKYWRYGRADNNAFRAALPNMIIVTLELRPVQPACQVRQASVLSQNLR